MNETLTAPSPAELAKGCEALNQLERDLAKCPPVEHHEVHRFTKHLASREFHGKAGTLCTSKIHKTEHQFIISKGKVRIWSPETEEWELFEAPYHGITKPGTRRALFILEDLIFTTFHATDITDIEELEEWLCETTDELPRLRAMQERRAIS